MNLSSHQSSTINSEIRALLMLVLLKGGTRAEKIQTALQMAALTNLNRPTEEFADAPEALAPRTPASAPDDNRLHRLTPKQVLRNSYLAPIKGYAA